MERRWVLSVFLMVLMVPAAATADIYRWQDANGVMHFSNEPPPAGARVIERVEETPYDAAADRQRQGEERRLLLENRQLEIEERKAQAAAREREAQLRLEQERNRRFEEMARSRPDEGYNDNDDYYLRYGTYSGPGYYRYGRPGDPNLYRGYYRNNNNLYYRNPHSPWPPPGTPPGPHPPGPTPLPANPARTPSADDIRGSAPQPVAPAPK